MATANKKLTHDETRNKEAINLKTPQQTLAQSKHLNIDEKNVKGSK